jgi:F-type H+-transporting ATPase subunit a
MDDDPTAPGGVITSPLGAAQLLDTAAGVRNRFLRRDGWSLGTPGSVFSRVSRHARVSVAPLAAITTAAWHPVTTRAIGMTISPDTIVVWQWGPLTINATLLWTWAIMAVLVVGSWLVTRRLSTTAALSRWQNALEVLVTAMRRQISDVSRQDAGPYLAFVGTLFLFIALANLLAIVPGYVPPTGSLSTTAALALCVFVAVPLYGIMQQGLSHYLKQYVQPTVFMLPFNIFGELSRTLALAVRLYGNIMSGTVIAAILLSLAPLFFPIVMQALGLLTGMIQAYIFAILAMVYIASATRAHHDAGHTQQDDQNR